MALDVKYKIFETSYSSIFLIKLYFLWLNVIYEGDQTWKMCLFEA